MNASRMDKSEVSLVMPSFLRIWNLAVSMVRTERFVSEAMSLVLRFMAMKAQIRISPGVSEGYAWLSREKKEGCRFSK